jgi:hypothetical protein
MYVNWMEFDHSDVPLSCGGGSQKAMGKGFTGVSKLASCRRKFMIAQIPFLGFKLLNLAKEAACTLQCGSWVQPHVINQ